MREAGKERFDESHRLNGGSFAIGDLVLLHDTARETSYFVKLRFRWLGPFRIAVAIAEKGTHIIESLDGVRVASTIAGNRLKKFHARPFIENHVEDVVDDNVAPAGVGNQARAVMVQIPQVGLEEVDFTLLRHKNGKWAYFLPAGIKGRKSFARWTECSLPSEESALVCI